MKQSGSASLAALFPINIKLSSSAKAEDLGQERVLGGDIGRPVSGSVIWAAAISRPEVLAFARMTGNGYETMG
jgi:hypothetical protein